jgi:hypothetical protein
MNWASIPFVTLVFHNLSFGLMESMVPVVLMAIWFSSWMSAFSSFNLAIKEKSKDQLSRESWNCGG